MTKGNAGRVKTSAGSVQKDATDAAIKRGKVVAAVVGGVAAVGLIGLAVGLNLGATRTGSDAVIEAIITDNGDLKIDWSRFEYFEKVLGGEGLTIGTSGVYHLTGEISDGMVMVNAIDGKVKLILDNVTIKNSAGPAIFCKNADDLVIEVVGDNYLEDGASYAANVDEDATGVIYSKDDLTLTGEGSLTVVAQHKDGIVGKDDLKISSGAYTVTAIDDGVRGTDSVYIAGGTVTITAKGDGIKSTNNATPGKGFVLIEGGEVSISAGESGISAYNSVAVTGGKLNIAKSYEGIEAQSVAVSGGEVAIVASDDGINAGGGTVTDANGQTTTPKTNPNCVIAVSGGSVYINAAGDGVDSNGYLYFDGGKIVIDGPTSNENGALDAGLAIEMRGGEVIAMGASGEAMSLGSASRVFNVNLYFTSTLPAGTTIEIRDAAGEIVMQHTSAKSFDHLAAGSAGLKFGETYSVWVNGAKTAEFTVTDTVTTLNGIMVAEVAK